MTAHEAAVRALGDALLNTNEESVRFALAALATDPDVRAALAGSLRTVPFISHLDNSEWTAVDAILAALRPAEVVTHQCPPEGAGVMPKPLYPIDEESA